MKKVLVTCLMLTLGSVSLAASTPAMAHGISGFHNDAALIQVHGGYYNRGFRGNRFNRFGRSHRFNRFNRGFNRGFHRRGFNRFNRGFNRFNRGFNRGFRGRGHYPIYHSRRFRGY